MKNTLEQNISLYFKNHTRNLNSDLIDKIRVLIENDFCKYYGYNWEEIDQDPLIQATSEEVWKITSFGILDRINPEDKKKLTDLLYAKENVRKLLESPNSMIDMHGLEYWAWVVERKREEVRKIL